MTTPTCNDIISGAKIHFNPVKNFTKFLKINMSLNLQNVLNLLNFAFVQEEEGTRCPSEIECQVADEIEVLLRQIKHQSEHLIPWAEIHNSLDVDPDQQINDADFQEFEHDPELNDDDESDNDEKSSEKRRIPFEYKKRAVKFWKNEDGRRVRSFPSVQKTIQKSVKVCAF